MDDLSTYTDAQLDTAIEWVARQATFYDRMAQQARERVVALKLERDARQWASEMKVITDTMDSEEGID